MQEYDLFVIGGGSGGVRCARIAAQNGARVGIVERRHWGGTCVNIGCVPKKLMVYAAEYGRSVDDARKYGWDASVHGHDWASFIASKDKEISRLNGIYVSLLEKAGVDLFTGEARFIDSETIEIGPSPLEPNAKPQKIRAKNIVVATGSTPTKPSIPGAEYGIVSDDAFHLEERPQRVAIIGGGYIGVEFAGIFAGLGSSVDLIYRQEHPLRGFDDELRTHLSEQLPLYGIKAHPQKTPEKIEKTETGYALHLEGGAVIEADCVFFATGRHPRIENLGLEKAGVVVKDGRIPVRIINSATNVPGIYAIGDVTAMYNLTPTAIAEGHLLAERLFGQAGREWSFATTPKAVFFSQPLASVGLTEEEASKNHKIDIYTSSFRPMHQTLSGREGRAFMKLVVDSESQVVLGAHMAGPEAAEIIQGLAIAVTAGLTKRDLDRTIGLHPTSAEEFVTMRTPTRHVGG
ncbi:glutathione reductase [Neokomagataea thailandica NBRC 106555]|uniref:Glutathione-disulfide reductase n=2 Tax=Neokomagataea TaxID=1223423 RepID=A0A4Y6V9Q2_9PROT|nr:MULTISPECIES: glutathione-disulfide reductase [Neokomagataea]QDH25187.1 glutathione-disulfide reductase [Neokomagataea tanensis]GBR54388.1 glutathione reductase [Neokomagataea thailandica NBRC 106555]